MRAAPVSVWLLLALPVSCTHAEATLRTVELSEVNLKSSFDMDAARAWQRPAGIHFEVEGGAEVKDDFVRVSGWLLNRSAEPQRVVLFPVGPLGLVVQPVPGTATRLPPPPGAPPRMMPAPPPPELLTLPGRSRLRVVAAFPLAEWAWEPGKPRELEWSYQFWDEPKPTGRLPIP